MLAATPDTPSLSDLDPNGLPSIDASRWELPFAFAAALVLAAGTLAFLHRDDGARSWAGTLAWVGVQVAALVALAVTCSLELLHATVDALNTCCWAASASGAAALLRHEFDRGRLVRVPDGARSGKAFRHAAAVATVAADLVALAGACVAGVAALELPWNPLSLEVIPQAFAVEFALVALALLAAALVAQMRGGAAAAVVCALCAVGLAQCFVIRFKGQPLMPADVLAAGTAMAVSDGYTYTLSSAMLQSVACAMAGVGACSLIRPLPAAGDATDARPHARRRVIARLASGVACAAAIAVSANTLPLDAMGLYLDYWSSKTLYACYCRQGFLPVFAMAFREMPISRPSGYDADEASRLEASYAEQYDRTLGQDAGRAAATEQFDQVKPSIVFVMNESFSDLSALGDVADGYAGPEFFSSELSGCVRRGSLVTSVIGGGTANTEFEVLTGNSCAFIGYGKHPYAMYDLAGVSSLASELSEVGYHAVAMHPNQASNWNRNRVYEQFGFDEFRDLDHYYGGQYFHSGVRDYCTYDDIIALLQSDDRPQFVYDVTMANHGGYDKGNVPERLRTGRTSSAASDETELAELNEYLDCVDASDDDLREFVSELEELDRPVVLVFFGDHQPSISTWLNDNLHTDDDNLTHQLRIFHTQYFVWANYDLAGSSQDDEVEDISANYLGSRVLELVGAPLTERRRSSLALRLAMPCVFPYGWEDADGTWHSLDLGKGLEGAALDAQKIQYLDFASRAE